MTSLRSAVSSTLPPIRAAITRAKRETIQAHLKDCTLLAGIWCHGLTVHHLQSLRRSLPPSTKLIVAKNSLVEKAIEGTKWEALKPCAKGMNAWLFVNSDELPPALKPYRDFQKEFKLALNDFTGAVFEGRLYGPDDFRELETMPTKMETYGYLLGCLQSPAVSFLGLLESSMGEKKGEGVVLEEKKD